MASVQFTIRGRPMARKRHRKGRFTAAYDPQQKEMDDAVTIIQKNAPKRLLEGPLRLSLEAWFPIPQSWSKKKQRNALQGIVRPIGKTNDFDNVAKFYADAMSGIVYADDGQIVTCDLWLYYGAVPHVEIIVKELNEKEQEDG